MTGFVVDTANFTKNQAILKAIKNRAESFSMKCDISVVLNSTYVAIRCNIYDGRDSFGSFFKKDLSDSFINSKEDLLKSLQKIVATINSFATPEARYRHGLMEKIAKFKEELKSDDPHIQAMLDSLAYTIQMEADRISKNAIVFEGGVDIDAI